VASGAFRQTDRFADLVLVQNRCDLLMPLRGATISAMHELLGDGTQLQTNTIKYTMKVE